jgi:hypothetical protein
MSLYTQFETDPEVEQDGIWLEFEGGERFKIRRAGGANKAYQRELDKATRAKKAQISIGKLSAEEFTELLVGVYAKTVVVTWTGVTDRDGKEIPYSQEACVRLLADLPELLEHVVRHAANHEWFRKIDAADAKN